MANEQKTITPFQEDELTPFEALLEKGVALLQQYAGSVWTDYNEHDPGFTILEELCYIITELFQRVNLPIADLLTAKNGQSMASNNAMFTAAQILHNNPLTPHDYRKLIIDKFKEVSNAWVIPYYFKVHSNEHFGVVGYYKVYAQLSKDSTTANDELCSKINKLLRRNRNIGEYFIPAEILNPVYLRLSATLYLTETTSVEQLLAEILYEIELSLKPEIDFYTYQQMQNLGLNTDEIFRGPTLDHGFILDENLNDKPEIIYVDSLLRQIISHPEVISVDKMQLMDVDDNVYTTKYPDLQQYKISPLTVKTQINPNESLELDFVGSISQLTVILKNVPYTINTLQVISDYNHLRSHRNNSGKYKLEEVQTDIPVPQGTYPNSELYYSLQHEFPEIYGIGRNKPTRKSTDIRKSNVLQLKAYLLFFEQVLADFMQQTSALSHLFSSKPQSKTYFYQPLYMVPDVLPLLSEFPKVVADIYDSSKALNFKRDAEAYTTDPLNPYMKGLQQIYDQLDSFEVRRSGFLDHLLGRFNLNNSAFTSDSSVINSEYANMSNTELKEILLTYLPQVTSTRAALSIKQPIDNHSNIIEFGLASSLRLLSGFKTPDFVNGERPHVTYLELDFKANATDLLFKVSQTKIAINTLHIYFYDSLSQGTLIENYSITTEQEAHQIWFNAPDKDLRQALFRANTLEEAKNLIQQIISDFAEFQKHYDNLYIIEHLLLMPDLLKPMFTFRFDNDSTFQMPPLMAYDLLQSSISEAINNQESHSVNPSVSIWVSSGKVLVHEQFFSSQISILLPKNANQLKTTTPFKDFFKYMSSSLVPAHIVSQIIWLDIENYPIFLSHITDYIFGKEQARNALLNYLITIENNKTYVIKNPFNT